jgi:cyclohexadienyl dehydratase
MFKALTALAFSFLLAATTAQAQQQPSRLDDIVKRGTLRVGMTGDYLPFTSRDKTSGKFAASTSTRRRSWARRSASRSTS